MKGRWVGGNLRAESGSGSDCRPPRLALKEWPFETRDREEWKGCPAHGMSWKTRTSLDGRWRSWFCAEVVPAPIQLRALEQGI